MCELITPVSALEAGLRHGSNMAGYFEVMGTLTASANAETDWGATVAAGNLLQMLHAGMLKTTASGPGRPRIDLAGVAEGVVKLVDRALGVGEVCIEVRKPVVFNIRQTGFAGIWRVHEFSSRGHLQRNAVIAAAIPYVAQQCAEMGASPTVETPPCRGDASAAVAILELLLERVRLHRPGMPAYVVNLSPVSVAPRDAEYLLEALGIGPVMLLSSGQNSCRIRSTRLSHVWSVQHFNGMGQIVLDTLEVVDIPVRVQAGAGEYAASTERLGKLLAATHSLTTETDTYHHAPQTCRR